MKVSVKKLWSLWLISLACVQGAYAGTGLTVSLEPGVPKGPHVLISQPRYDNSGNTSVRYQSNKEYKEEKPGLPESGGYFNRDRDLGQTFTVGEKAMQLSAIVLRTGPVAGSVIKGAQGAKVSLQLLKVSGTPVIDNNGTTKKGEATNATWTDDPRIDDVIYGEVFEHLMLVSGGRLPDNLTDNKYMKWEFTGDPVVLQPNTTYAFMVMLDECMPDQAFTLSNLYWGTYRGGHGLRREGKLVPVGANWKDKEYSMLNPLTTRIYESPGTKGRPDVDTWRDLCFFILGSYLE